MARWARVVNGVVMESPIDYPQDPNVMYENVNPPPTFFECDAQVDCWWLYDGNTQTFSPPPPITDPPLGGDPGGEPPAMLMLQELKSNPELLAELRKLLVE